MDDKHIIQHIRRNNLTTKEFMRSQYNFNDSNINHFVKRSYGLSSHYQNKMPVDGEIKYPEFLGETNFIDTNRRKYPTQNSLKQKKELFFISKNDEF